MGLLDSIIRRATNRVANAAADKVVDQMVDSIRGNGQNGRTGSQTNYSQPNYNQQSSQQSYQQNANAGYQNDFCNEAECRRRVLQCLNQNFGSYNIQENVPSTIFGERGGLPYSIMVSQGSSPKLVIMIIGKTTVSRRNYRFSRQAAESKGVTLINFIGHYPNRPEYILNRLRQYL